MSIIQVMDSTRSGRAVYIVASTLLAVALAPIILPSLGIDFELTVEAMVSLAPIIGGLSLLFYGIKPETIVVECIALYFINRKDEKEEIKVQMATALLYVSPWESSPKQAYVVDESLNLDLERMLRSPQFGEQISELQQVFWILFLLPFTLIDVVIIYSTNYILMSVIIVLGLLSASLILWRNRMILDRIISYAYASWFYESTSADLSRRKASLRIKSRHQERLESSLDLTKPIIDLATSGDWRGFDRKSRNLEHLVGLPGYDTLTWSLVENYVTFLDWCATHIHNRHASHVDIFLKNGRIHVTSAISVFRECRNYSLSAEEELVAKTLQITTSCSEDRETYLKLNVEFYERLEKESLKNLKDGYLDILGRMPFKLHELQPPGVRTEIKRLDRLSWLIVSAAERGLVDMQRSLSVVASWGTHPTTILTAIGPLGTKVILENEVGFPIDQLSIIARALGKQLQSDDRTDPDLVLKHLEKLGGSNPRNLIKKYATTLCVDSIRTKSEKPQSGLEAITRFCDAF